MSRDHIDLSRLDLNLLVTFDALAVHTSVTRAAQHLGVTQSAVSHSLRRLRELFEDPLLVRVRGGMALTPRAESLVVPIRSGLSTLQRAFSNPLDFDPQVSGRGFRIAGPDLFELLFLPTLLQRAGPHLRFSMTAGSPSTLFAELETGETDLAITNRLLDEPPEAAAPGLMRKQLLRDHWRCFVRKDHPGLGSRSGRLSLSAYLKYPHAIISPSGRGSGVVDRVLAARGEQRRVALRVSHFYSAPIAIAASDLILTAPAALTQLVDHLPLVVTPPPLKLPDHIVDMTWHERFREDPGHRWLRSLLADATCGFASRA